MINRCIIIQGPTEFLHVQENKMCWKNNPIIFSTWVDADKSAYDLENDTVLYNEYPKKLGPDNWNYQRISTLNGIILAKEKGYNRIVKWRSDFKTNNAGKLLNLFNLDKINFYAFMNHRGGYVTDFFMEGNIDDMFNIFNTNTSGDFPERILTNRIYELNLDKKINFICKQLNKNANVYWHKHNYWFTNNNHQENYLDKII